MVDYLSQQPGGSNSSGTIGGGLPISIYVTGVNKAMMALAIANAELQVRGIAGMYAGAKLVQKQAKTNLNQHRWHGTTASKVVISGPPRMLGELGGAPYALGGWISFTVGIPHEQWPAFAVGATFEHGWHSKRGKQPPTAPLAKWAVSRGLVRPGQSAKQVGFIIARTIKKRGYSFGEHHWLRDAWIAQSAAVAATVEHFLGMPQADQPRSRGGQFGFR